MTTIDSGKVNIIADIKGLDNKIKDNNNNLVKRKRGRPQHLKTSTTENEVYKLSIVSLSFSRASNTRLPAAFSEML